MHLTRVETSDIKRVSLFWHTLYVYLRPYVVLVIALLYYYDTGHSRLDGKERLGCSQ